MRRAEGTEDIVDYLKVIFLGIVEGITEFLPISSTGHLILVESFLTLDTGPGFAEAFMVIIQLPAILAVVVFFWKKIWPFQPGQDPAPIIRLWTKIAVGVLPAVVLGLLFADFIEERLFAPLPVACALITGGIILILIERRDHTIVYDSAFDITYRTALIIGFFQCLAMVPGTSRSAATIIGGLLMRASRPAAAEFSFFLAIPTMLGATILTVYKSGVNFSGHEWGLLAVGSLVSFVVAYFSIMWLMRFLKYHKFTVFGYYRIVLGICVILLLVWGSGNGAEVDGSLAAP